MGMATGARAKVRPWVQADEAFRQLEEALLRHYRGHRFPISGYITMGDLQGSQNEAIAGFDDSPASRNLSLTRAKGLCHRFWTHSLRS
ncbi:hypothetical protein O1611_g3341 [Lasiodiplodia mahajangana]|uniref:Uncharacterized protein n=1 Tax=Lasiodiplodia mahajangana TaxID=1108764 RepID=A0ACC2JSQ0_9PEZI|nr:hypothetical protein O1611_g3341 [Lasiodiplodia mahajangana]